MHTAHYSLVLSDVKNRTNNQMAERSLQKHVPPTMYKPKLLHIVILIFCYILLQSTESGDTVCAEIKENLQPLPQEAAGELDEKKIFEVDEVPTHSKSQNISDTTTSGRRFMGRDVCLVNCGKAPVTEKPKREENVVEESRLNLVPPVNRQKRLTELLRAIDGFSK